MIKTCKSDISFLLECVLLYFHHSLSYPNMKMNKKKKRYIDLYSLFSDTKHVVSVFNKLYKASFLHKFKKYFMIEAILFC